MSCGRALVELLDSCGIKYGNAAPESFNWLFQKDDLQHMFQWLCTNIDCGNVLQPYEIKEYERLKAENQALYGDELDKAVERLEKLHPDLFLDNEQVALDDLSMELRNLQNEEYVLSNMISAHKYVCSKQNVSLDKLAANITKLKIDLENVTETCEKDACEIDRMTGNIYGSLKELYEWLNTDSAKCAVSVESWSSIIKYSHYLRRAFDNFKIAKNSWLDLEYVSLNYESNADALKKAILCNLESQLKVEKELKIATYLQSPNVSLTEESLITILKLHASESTKSCRIALNAKVQELNNLARLHAEGAVRSLSQDLTAHILECRKNALKDCKKLNESFVRFIDLVNNISQLLLKNQVNCLEHRELFEKTSKSLIICQADMRANELKMTSQTDIVKNKFLKLPQVACHLTVGMNDSESLENQAERLNQSNRKIRLLEHKLFIDSTFSKDANYGIAVEEMQSLLKRMTSSSTKEIVAMSPELFGWLIEVRSILLEISDEILQAKATLITTKETLEQNRIVKEKRLLWQYFLREPKKIIKVLRRLESDVRARKFQPAVL